MSTAHKARKRFGQNFLQDTRIITDIVNAVRPQPDDIVIEIGPGLAAITEPLTRHLRQLHVCEIDRDIIRFLKEQPFADKLVIHEGDVLQFDFGSITGRKKIVGNLPYNISTPLLFHLAEVADEVADMHFMLQKEVVERMVARIVRPRAESGFGGGAHDSRAQPHRHRRRFRAFQQFGARCLPPAPQNHPQQP